MATIAFIGTTKTLNLKLQGVSSNVLRIVPNTISVDIVTVPHFLDRAGRKPLAKAPSIGNVCQVHTSITSKRLLHVLHPHISFSARDVASPRRNVVGLTSEWARAHEYSPSCKHSTAHVPSYGWNASGDRWRFQGLASFSPSHSRSWSKDYSRIDI